jgi:hypothetical protein
MIPLDGWWNFLGGSQPFSDLVLGWGGLNEHLLFNFLFLRSPHAKLDDVFFSF